MYESIRINQISMSTSIFNQSILTKLKGLRPSMGIKGGFAREIFKVAIGTSVKCPLEKMNDLDVAVFEDQKQKKV